MRVLCIDSGGTRVLVPATVLAEIERRMGRPVMESFDLVVGTSTGALLAAAVASPDRGGRPRSAQDVLELLPLLLPSIYERSLLKQVTSLGGLIDERYDSAGLDRAIEELVGDTLLSTVTPDLAIPAYEITERRPFLFSSARTGADPEDDYRVADAVRAACATPLYFPPAEVDATRTRRSYALVDASIYAANPALLAITEARKQEPAVEDLLIVSLGAGRTTRALQLDEARSWGALEWGRPLLDLVMDASATANDEVLRSLLPTRSYVRLQPLLHYASDALDDASAANLRRLSGDAERLIAERSADLDAICAQLDAGGPAFRIA